MKILHVIKNLPQGGIETVLNDITRITSDMGHENLVVTFASPPQYMGSIIESNGIKVEYAGIDKSTPADGGIDSKDMTSADESSPYSEAILEAAKKFRPDIVMSWNAKTNILCTKLAEGRLLRVPVCWAVQGDNEQMYLNEEEFEEFKRFSGKADKIIYVSQVLWKIMPIWVFIMIMLLLYATLSIRKNIIFLWMDGIGLGKSLA